MIVQLIVIVGLVYILLKFFDIDSFDKLLKIISDLRQSKQHPISDIFQVQIREFFSFEELKVSVKNCKLM